ncbi:MAG: hypothetical protein AAF322_20725, partial [Pseudomonadota bacterium]
EEEARLLRQLNDQTASYNDKALELETARSRGQSGEVDRKRRELAALKAELDATNRQIAVMAQ